MNVKEEALIPSGLPRNDGLYHVTKDEVIAIKKKLGLPLDKKIMMYAPTWRDSYDKGASYAIKPPMDLKKWEEKLKDEYVLLFRTHAYTTKLLGVEFDDFCLDYTSYPVINDLFKVADILISVSHMTTMIISPHEAFILTSQRICLTEFLKPRIR